MQCPALQLALGASDLFRPSDQAIDSCASAVGSDWRFYGTADTVEDIEALRRALGVDRLTLDGRERVPQRLVDAGVPATEIAFVHDADTDAQKATLFKAVREGRVRLLLGSTAKLGIGTNVQTRLAALHHLDAPWRP